MRQQPLRDVYALIVEDDHIQLKGLGTHLDKIDEDRRSDWGINSFQSSLADSVEKANDLIKTADLPYDILILDLELPNRKGVDKEKTDNGHKFLESINKDIVKEIIIVSSFSHYDHVVKAMRKGAVDFIAKPYRRELLQTQVLESWKRVLEKDSAHLMQERLKELVHYNERGLAYRHTVCFGKFADEVLHRTATLEEHANSRYGLNRTRDPQDYFVESLVGFEESVNAAKQMWMNLQVPSLPQEESHRAETIGPMLFDLEQALLPCLIVKKMKLEILPFGEIKVLTFQNDVRAILKELLSGALSEISDYNSQRRDATQPAPDKELPNLIEIEVSAENGQASVKFTDNLQPISIADAEQINRGSFIVSEKRFSRTWGLTVMQHIAVLGGGRLAVEPLPQGNIITFLIPLDSDA